MGEPALSKEAQSVKDGNLGVICISYDCRNDDFRYEADTGEKLAGVYDVRPFWEILQSDHVANEEDTKAVRAFVLRACMDGTAKRDKLLVSLFDVRGASHRFWVRITGEYDADGQAERLTILLIDVTEEAEANVQLQHRTVTDDLTGLLLRNVFLSRVEALVAGAPPRTYVMVYFDIDEFSVINDRYGHAKGDEFLRFIADTIRRTCGESCLCCRIHADCFAVCTENDPAHMESFVHNYQQVLRNAKVPFEINASFGLCVIDDLTLSSSIILDRAALAQRSVKGSYITRYAYYDDALRRIRLQRQAIESEMNAALKQGQFDIYIQPQFALSTGRLIGGEALARWFHPERGMIMPGEFVPIFEQNGFIRELDSYVWERACKLLKKWIAEDGEDALSISVNISRVNLLNMDVTEKLCALTEQYGVPPRMLRLEVTESAYADNPQQLIDVVARLQARGFTVEMDDFGSGYSSLNTLKEVPVNALKLDLRFLAGDNVSGRGGSIINSVIRMARWLQLPIVAEGVETQRQADFLHSVGCDFVQGFLYGKGIPVAEFEAMMRACLHGRYGEVSTQVNMADANAFWNPDSQETLIFNSYVGGAAIMEYADGHVELLRANKKFRAMMRMENIGRHVYILEKIMFPEDHARFIAMLENAMESGEEGTCITRLHDGNKGGESCFWLRNRVRVLCKSRTYTIFYIAIEDITAEREAQQRYHISQDTLMAAAAHTHLQYWTYDMVRNASVQGIEAANNDSGLPKYIENYPQALFALGFIHPDHVETYRKLHTDLKNGAHTVSADVLTGGEGHWQWRKIRYTAVPDADGVIRSAIGTSESLTAYKELEHRFLIAARQCGLLTWVLNIDARSIRVEALDADGDLMVDEIPNMPDGYIARGTLHPDDVAAFAEAYQRMFDGASESTANVRIRLGKGDNEDWSWQRLTFTAVADKDGRTGIAVCTGMDVTEQVNMQMRYREALSYYENLNPDEYVSILHANITEGTVRTPGGGVMPYLQSTQRLTQYIEDEAECTQMEEALLPETLVQEYARGASKFVYEYRMRFADGAMRWVRTTVRLLMDTGKQELCAFIYTTDINEEKMKSLVFTSIVLDDYDFVTIIDTERDSYTMFIKDSSDTYLPSADKYTFSDAAEIVALTTAPEEDAHLYIRETRIPYMIRRLSNEGSYSFLYRSIQADGTLRRKRMSLRLIDAHTKHVCLTRLDVDRLSTAE